MTELDCCHVDDDISEEAQLRRWSLCTQMAEEGDVEGDVPVLLPREQLTEIGVTYEEVEQYPRMTKLSDKVCFATAECCRKNLVGVNGTNLQMMQVIDGKDQYVMGQVCLFLVKNRIKPMLSDMVLLVPLLKETARRLGEGDITAVNRRHELRVNGVLTADDVVPGAVRSEWIDADGQERAAAA